jgi:tRNA 2-thiouridine synthesizing protein B
MSVLHVINKSPYDRNSLDSCLRLAKAGSALLFIEDGVYAAKASGGVSDMVKAAMANHKIYALSPDLEARGIGTEQMIEGVSPVNYDGFVELTTEYDKVQSWL